MEENIILIDKPAGITSFDVIRRLRRELSVRKMGHAGTLDPLASGLLIVGVGEGTKKLSAYLKLPKEYVAEVLIGERRSTGDMEGMVVESEKVERLQQKDVANALKSMVGVLTLPVSAYSAIKQGGVPMYKRARAAAKEGREVGELPLRDMAVHEAELIHLDSTPIDRNDRVVVTVRFSVGSGTYIRSLAEELGRRMGYPATLKSLRRTKVGEFRVEDARPLPG